jgi:hypothetical protein
MKHATTSLHQIRAFLDRHGAATPAWSEPERAVDALYELLRARRDDPAFWADLADLTRRLDDARVRPELVEGSEVLGLESVDHLLAELRTALPSTDRGPRTAREWIGAGIGLGALASFLLLGTSIGCPAPDHPGVNDDDDEYTPCTEATDAGIQDEAEQRVFCDLVDLIESAEIPPGVRDDLLACLPELGAEERSDLLDEFENASEEELADLLEELAVAEPCGEGGDDDTTPWDDDDH